MASTSGCLMDAVHDPVCDCGPDADRIKAPDAHRLFI
jgi:hypothetical protein